MSKTSCSACYVPKAPFQCSCCQAQLCKKCAIHVHQEDYPLFTELPSLFAKDLFCPACFDSEARETLEHYKVREELARELPYFSQAQSKETRLMPRPHPVIKVTDLADRSDVIMKLAFRTLELGFNAMIDLETQSVKVRHGGYQTLRWSGSAAPTTLDLEMLARRQERR
jgi:hypothetical protein